MKNDLGKIPYPKRWTRQAVYCHSIHCNCSQCDIFDEFKKQCMMKATLIELTRIYGLPDEETYNRLLHQYYTNSGLVNKRGDQL